MNVILRNLTQFFPYSDFFSHRIPNFSYISHIFFGALPNFSSIFPFFPFSPFRKVKMGKKSIKFSPFFLDFPHFSHFSHFMMVVGKMSRRHRVIDSAKRHLFGPAARYLQSGRFGQSRGVGQGSGIRGVGQKN